MTLNSRAAAGMAALLGLGLVLFYLRAGWPYLVTGQNDYLQLYSGARLVERSELYQPGRSQEMQMETAGFYGEALEYTRPPFYAALLWPLGRLPYRRSYLVWQALSIAALFGFIVAWNVTRRDLAMLACCWSVPLVLGIEHGQDLTFLLFLLAVVLRIEHRRPLVAGVLLSFCAIKFNLFFLLPLPILAQRRWRMLEGLVTGGAALTAISFAAAGAAWPRLYFGILTMGSISPEAQIMPNIAGALLHVPHRFMAEALLSGMTAVMVWFVARRANFPWGLAAALVGGLLVSHHAYPQDCMLLIPALLIVISQSSSWVLNYLCVALCTPWPYLELMNGDRWSLVRLAISALLAGMAITWRSSSTSIRTPLPPAPDPKAIAGEDACGHALVVLS